MWEWVQGRSFDGSGAGIGGGPSRTLFKGKGKKSVKKAAPAKAEKVASLPSAITPCYLDVLPRRPSATFSVLHRSLSNHLGFSLESYGFRVQGWRRSIGVGVRVGMEQPA